MTIEVVSETLYIVSFARLQILIKASTSSALIVIHFSMTSKIYKPSIQKSF